MRFRVWDNTRWFRREIEALGFDTMGSQTPIVPVRFGDSETAARASRLLFDEGVFTVAIGYPVVPRGSARIRNIVTAEHTPDDLEAAIAAYRKVGRALGAIP